MHALSGALVPLNPHLLRHRGLYHGTLQVAECLPLHSLRLLKLPQQLRLHHLQLLSFQLIALDLVLLLIHADMGILPRLLDLLHEDLLLSVLRQLFLRLLRLPPLLVEHLLLDLLAPFLVQALLLELFHLVDLAALLLK